MAPKLTPIAQAFDAYLIASAKADREQRRLNKAVELLHASRPQPGAALQLSPPDLTNVQMGLHNIVLPLLHVVVVPSADGKHIEKRRWFWLPDALTAYEKEPRSQIAREREWYGKDHPLGRATLDRLVRIKAVRRDLEKFRRQERRWENEVGITALCAKSKQAADEKYRLRDFILHSPIQHVTDFAVIAKLGQRDHYLMARNACKSIERAALHLRSGGQNAAR